MTEEEIAHYTAHINTRADKAERWSARRTLGIAYANAVDTDDVLLTQLRAHLADRFNGSWDNIADVLTIVDKGVKHGISCWLDEAVVSGEQRLILTWIAARAANGAGSRVVEEIRVFAEQAHAPLIIGDVTKPEYWAMPPRSWLRDTGERTPSGNPNLRYDPPHHHP